MERHDKIQSFKPETYWVLQAKVLFPLSVPSGSFQVWVWILRVPFILTVIIIVPQAPEVEGTALFPCG